MGFGSTSSRGFGWRGLGWVLWLVSAAVSSADQECPTDQPVVILFRGGAGYWPRVECLERRLRDLGYCPSSWRARDHGKAAAWWHGQTTANGQTGRRLVVVGYSSGGDSACRFGRKLARCGLKVDTMVLIETTLGVSVPCNVDYCFNLYESNPGLDWIPILRGVKVSRDGCETLLENVDIRRDDRFADLRCYGHLNLASNDAVHELVCSVISGRTRNADFASYPIRLSPGMALDAP